MSSSSRITSGSTTIDQDNNEKSGIPKICSVCGNCVSLKYSKSESNPRRRYYRCNLAADLKLSNDDHLFKWLDDALLEEVTILSRQNSYLAKDVSDLFFLLEDTALAYRVESKNMKLFVLIFASLVAAGVLGLILL